jgi:hypothetical protein
VDCEQGKKFLVRAIIKKEYALIEQRLLGLPAGAVQHEF